MGDRRLGTHQQFGLRAHDPGPHPHLYPPLDFLDPESLEATFIFKGVVSEGTQVTDGQIFETSYEGGVFRIDADSTADFEFGTNPPNDTAPLTFVDGELILEGTLDDFYVLQMDFGQPPGATGTFSADWVFTGAALYEHVSGCHGPMLGAWTDDPDVAPIPEG